MPHSGPHDNHQHGNQTQTHSERSSLDSTSSPLSASHSTSQLGGEEEVVEDEKEEGRAEGEGCVVTNDVDPVPSPMSRKLWERKGVGVSGDGEGVGVSGDGEGVGVSGDREGVGVSGDGEEDENEGEERGEDSTAGDIKEKPIHEENGVEVCGVGGVGTVWMNE